MPPPIRLRFLLGSLLLSLSLSAQFQLSNRLDPFAGIGGALLQPAGSLDHPDPWDVHLAGAHATVSTNYGYVEAASALALWRASRTSGRAPQSDEFRVFALGNRLFGYDYREAESYYGRVGVDVLGPAFSLRVGSGTRVGLLTRTRFVGSTVGLDEDFGFDRNVSITSGTQLDIDELFIGGAVWSEVGVHFAQGLLVGVDGEFRLGGNVRYLFAHEAAFVRQPPGGALTKTLSDSLVVINGRVGFGFSAGVLNEEAALVVNGTGLGVDLGVQYAWHLDEADDYRYRVGVSVLDVGRLAFSEASNERHLFARSGRTVLVDTAYTTRNGVFVRPAIRELSGTVYAGDSTASLVERGFTVGLPTTVSAQFSAQTSLGAAGTKLRLGVAYVGDLRLRREQLTRGEQLGLTAHVGRRWWGVGTSLSWLNRDRLALGMQLRAGPFYLGTDRLAGTLVSTDEMDAASLYAGIRWSGGTGKSGGRTSGSRKRSGRGVKCYEF